MNLLFERPTCVAINKTKITVIEIIYELKKLPSYKKGYIILLMRYLSINYIENTFILILFYCINKYYFALNF